MTQETDKRIRKETYAKLSKYGTEQLLTKLEKGKLLGISEEIALEILEKREEKKKDSDSKGNSWAKNGSHIKSGEEKTEVEETPVEEPEEEKIEKVVEIDIEEGEEKAEKIEKVEKEVPLGKIVAKKTESSDLTKEQLDQVDTVVKSDSTKSEKIRKLHKIGLSILQISKIEGLGAIYQQVRSVVKKIEA